VTEKCCCARSGLLPMLRNNFRDTQGHTMHWIRRPRPQ
jgi:hypothetical protein